MGWVKLYITCELVIVEEMNSDLQIHPDLVALSPLTVQIETHSAR